MYTEIGLSWHVPYKMAGFNNILVTNLRWEIIYSTFGFEDSSFELVSIHRSTSNDILIRFFDYLEINREP